MLSVDLLGALTFRLDGCRLPAHLSAQERLLAGFLFSDPGKVYRRGRLAEMFWHHLADDERSRGALNTALWRIRRVLSSHPDSHSGACLATTPSEVLVKPVTWLEVDVVCFEREVKRLLGTPLRLASDFQVRALQRVVASYVAPFFEDEDADWVIERRERLHSMYVHVATELLHAHVQIGHISEAIDLARQVLSFDHFRESIHRDLLTLLVLSGERTEALRLHRRWAVSLMKELEVPPMPETQALIQDICSGQLLADPAHPARRHLSLHKAP